LGENYNITTFSIFNYYNHHQANKEEFLAITLGLKMVYEFHKSKNLFETADMPFNQQLVKQNKSKEFELISVYFANLKHPQP
jgi:hypothetical protein